MHLYAWLLPNVRLKGKNFIDICLIYKEIIKNIFLSRLLETGLFEKKKKKKRLNSDKFSLFTRFFLPLRGKYFRSNLYDCVILKNLEKQYL